MCPKPLYIVYKVFIPKGAISKHQLSIYDWIVSYDLWSVISRQLKFSQGVFVFPQQIIKLIIGARNVIIFSIFTWFYYD